jgi:allantoin racemase
VARLPILMLNPNSSVEVTDRIAWAARDAWQGADPVVKAMTLETGPPGIVSQQHIDDVTPMVAAFVREHENAASAFIVACFSDPGMFAARAVTQKPVIGIGEAGISEALSIGKRVGVVAISSAAKERHYRYYEQLGLRDGICGERAIDLSPRDSGDETLAFGRIVAAAAALRDQDGADVIVLGCAGMAQLRPRIQDAVKLRVVDPCAAAVRFAVAKVQGGP